MKEKELYKISEAAKILNVSRQTIYILARYWQTLESRIFRLSIYSCNCY